MDTQFARVTLLAIGLTGLAAVSLAGCNQESNYCDDTGCYFCDGLGCRLVNPPTRTTCNCPSDCVAGSSCTSLGCTVTCTTDAACPMGTRCTEVGTSHFCMGPREPVTNITTNMCICGDPGDPVCPGGRICSNHTCVVAGCSATNPCPSGQECVGGTCQTPISVVGCDATHPCATGAFCLDGSCVPQTDTCQFNTECNGQSASRVCVNQQCTNPCSASNPCPTGAMCGSDGYCHEVIPPVTGCVANSDCTGAGETCVNGRCFAGCVHDSDCPTGDFCDAGVCRLDTRLAPHCGNGAPCASGAVCHNGACRSPCTMDSDCPRFDVQTPFCDIPQMVCETTAEATSNCTTAADCHTAGQSCVNGTCH